MKKELKGTYRLTADLLLDILTSFCHCLMSPERNKKYINAMKEVLNDYIEYYDDDINKRPKNIRDLMDKISYKFPYVHRYDSSEHDSDNYLNAYKYVIPLVINIQKKYIDILDRYALALLKEIQLGETNTDETIKLKNELELFESRAKRLFNTDDIEYVRKILKLDENIDKVNKGKKD